MWDLRDHVVSECVEEYKNLIPIFNIGYRRSYSTISSRHFDVSIYTGPTISDYSVVRPTLQNTWKSVLAMDYKPLVTADPHLLQQALEDVSNIYEVPFDQPFDYDPEFVLNTSGTFPYTAMGLRKKSDVILSPQFFEMRDNILDYPSIWRVSPKEEIKIMTDIQNGKIRTFIIPPMHLLWWQKFFWGKQDDFLKTGLYGSTRMGVSFSKLGLHDMLMRHGDPKTRKFFGMDISGWDRRLPIMRLVYQLRCRKQLDPDLEKIRQYVVDNTVDSYLLLPNGDLVRKGWGNNSGSGNTTGDNCIAHEIIVCYARRILKSMGFDPEDLIVDIYGDDSLMSIPDFWDIDVQHFMSSIYASFNLDVKPGSFFLTHGPAGAMFLGAEIVEFEGVFVPSYSSSRIRASMAISPDRHSFDDEVAKYFSLLHLAWNDRVMFDEIRQSLKNCISINRDGPYLRFLRRWGIPTWEQVIYGYWIGAESQRSQYLEEEVFKNIMNNVVKNTILGEK